MNACNNKIEISVVIPAYNCLKYFGKTVESVLRQTVIPKEIIIIDDCSNDGTYSIALRLAKETEGLVKVYRQENNSGVSSARNRGIRLAISDWILFMDADDIAEPELIERECRCINELQKQWEAPVVLVHSAYRQITEEGNLLGIHRWKQVEAEEILGYELVRNQITTSGALVKKAIILQAGGFDEDLKYSEDWDLWLKMTMYGGFGYVDDPLVQVRRHSENASGKIGNMLGGEKFVLNRYDVSVIERAIHKRKLPYEINQGSFIEILYRLGRWEDGYRLAEDLISEYPECAIGHFLDSLYHLQCKNWKKAKESLLATICYSPQHGASLNNLGVVFAFIGETDSSIKMLKAAILLFPQYIDAQHNLDLVQQKKIAEGNAKFTWRELRPVLLSYTQKEN